MAERNGQGRTALVTGASRGIGHELARLFARDGYDLVLVARDCDSLERVAKKIRDEFGVKTRVIVKDLSRAQAPQEIYDLLKKEGIAVDALVNNAGFGIYGHFAEVDAATELALMQVNMVSLTHLTRLFVKDMLAKGSGKILNVGSLGAFQAGPLKAVYYASKAYVLSFSESLANELRGTGVTVTVFCPGPTQTEFHERAGTPRLKILHSMMMDARLAAKIGYDGMRKGKTTVVPGFRNKLIILVSRLLPKALMARIVSGLPCPGNKK